jgi:hypothetical protein
VQARTQGTNSTADSLKSRAYQQQYVLGIFSPTLKLLRRA